MKRPLRSFIPLFFLIIVSSTNGQIENVKFKNFGINDGLSYSLITGILQDDKGYLWISTQNGLNRYDGYDFKHYFAGNSNKTILKNHVSHIFKDSHGQIWLHYFKEGIGKYDPEHDEFLVFVPDPDKPGSFPFTYLFRDDVISFNQQVFWEDNDNNVWIASEKGVIIYKRKSDTFETIQKNDSPKSLSNNYINTVKFDDSGFVWVGTKDGLNRIDKKSGDVTRVFTSLNIPGLNNKPIVTQIFLHDDGSLWLATVNMGLIIIENPNDTSNIRYKQYNSQFLTNNSELTIYTIYKTQNEKILIGSSSGLYDIKYENLKIDLNKTRKLVNANISFIVEDDNGNIWAGGDPKLLNTNLYRFDKSLQHLIRYGRDKKTFNNFGKERISLISRNKDGLIFVGTIKGGFYIINTNAKKFGLLNSDTKNGAFLTNNNVYSIYEDKNDNLWIGTAQSLFEYNLKTGHHRNFNNYQVNRNNINYNYSKNLEAKLIGVIKEDDEGRLWLGSFDYKINIYDPKKDIFINFHHNPSKPNSFTGWSVRSICITRSGQIYIGGTSMGLCKVNRKDLTFSYYTTNDKNGPSDMWINSIIEDSDGYLWLGTFEGLDRFDPKTEKFTFYSIIPDTLYHTKVNVRTIFEPVIRKSNYLWIGSDKGLIRFNKNTGSVKHFTTKNGLPNNTILGILEDNNGFLWLSSMNGLIKFDPVTFKVTNYNKEDGLQSNEFNEGAFFKNSKGIMYFGGINGITYFNPDQIYDEHFSGKTLISEFKINQNPVLANVPVNNRIILTKDITYTKKLNLTHKERLLSFTFATSNLSSPNDIIYRYKLEGLEDKWNVVPANQRFAKYSDLKSGSYILKIDSKLRNGPWSDNPATLKIIIAPYLWETTWFKTAVAFLLIIMIGSYLQWRTYNLRKQKKFLEAEVKKRTEELNRANKSLEEKNEEILRISKKTHEVDMMKLRFFTNISHEFRTPLTLILNPAEKLLKSINNTDPNILEENLKVINRNGKRLYKLINQLLELPKIDSGTLGLSVSEDDIVKYINDILNLFKKYADSRNIILKFQSEYRELKVLFDKDKIEKILYNLLSNAIDHTPEGKAVTISLTKDDKNICLKIADSGKGIPEDKIEHIFERFYQIEKSAPSTRMSTGIGLSLVQSLVKTYRGNIKVSSKINAGTEFRVSLPYKKEGFEKHEIQNKPEEPANYNYLKSMLAFSEEQALKHPGSNANVDIKTNNKEITIVIIEDNIELNRYLCHELNDEYNIFTAYNGNEGLKLIQKHLPNIVISDVMMPEMDGIELCKAVKTDIKTSHIPVFLLTAKTEQTDQLEGLNVGADDYIAKPFSIDILKLRISNAIKTRKLLLKKFSIGGNSIPDGIDISPLDQDLLKKIVSYVEKNIDTEITGDILAAELGLSKSNLYKKLKDLTGLSVNIYIRNIRLNIASQLLKKGNYGISDVAYAVGFNNPKYFSSCFLKYHGKSPRDFMLSEKKGE